MKKRKILEMFLLLTGDWIDGGFTLTSSTFVLMDHEYIEIRISSFGKLMWTDPYISRWEGAALRIFQEKLNEKYNWMEE